MGKYGHISDTTMWEMWVNGGPYKLYAIIYCRKTLATSLAPIVIHPHKTPLKIVN